MKTMKKIFSALLLLTFPVSCVFAEAPAAVVYQGQSVAPKGILVSNSNTRVYMGRLVAAEPPVVRGILIATPYTYTAPRYYSNAYYDSYDSDPVVDTLVTIGVVGGLIALFSLGGHGHYYGGYSHHGWGRHC